jgi:predicted dehydrogenase
MRVAVVGTGYVSNQYAPTLKSEGARLVCHDVDPGRQHEFAVHWDAEEAADLASLTGLDLAAAVNLTPPMVHAGVTRELLELGIPVYSEKPLAYTLERGRALAYLSATGGVPLACAPDTILGESEQLLRAFVDRGLVGRPLWINAAHTHRGHELWHPRPHFFFRPGAGPIFDVGPWWIAAMVNLVGPVSAVTASGYTPDLERLFRDEDGSVTNIEVNVATSCGLLLEFESGPRASLLLSYDLFLSDAPTLEIIGDEGALMVREPLYRGQGPVLHRARTDQNWSLPPDPPSAQPWRRGIGVLEFVRSIGTGRRSRLDAVFALHALAVMEAAKVSLETGRRMPVSCGLPTGRPDPMLDGSDDLAA